MCYGIEDIEDVRALAKSVRDMTRLSDPDALFMRICRAVLELTDFSWTVLGLVDHDDAIRPVAALGHAQRYVDTVVPWGEGLGGSAVRERESQLCDGGWAVENENLTLIEQYPGCRVPVTSLERFVPPEGAAVAHPIEHAGMVVAILYAGRASSLHRHEPLAMVSELATFIAPLIVSVIRASDLEVLAKAEERQRIVRHLHDTSLQLLFNISLAAQRLARDPVLSRQSRALAVTINDDARSASACLRNTFRANLPRARSLEVAMRELTKAFTTRTMIPAEVTTLGAPRECPEAVDRALLSTAREILHNIEKHAQARSVMVGLAFGESDLTLVIQDDGIGLQSDHATLAPRSSDSPGLGMRNMHAVAATVGGQVHWSANEDGGLTTRVQVPLNGVA